MQVTFGPKQIYLHPVSWRRKCRVERASKWESCEEQAAYQLTIEFGQGYGFHLPVCEEHARKLQELEVQS